MGTSAEHWVHTCSVRWEFCPWEQRLWHSVLPAAAAATRHNGTSFRQPCKTHRTVSAGLHAIPIPYLGYSPQTYTSDSCLCAISCPSLHTHQNKGQKPLKCGSRRQACGYFKHHWTNAAAAAAGLMSRRS